MKKRPPPRLKKLPAAKQRRLDELLDKNGEGTITKEEQGILQRLVDEAERLMAANAKRLAGYYDHAEAAISSAGAVPVTVWVKPGSENLDDAG